MANSKNNSAFLQVLAGCNDATAGMDLSDDGWKPPDATYDVEFINWTTGTKEKDGIVNAWAKPVFMILSGDFADKTFSDYFWLPPNPMEPSMSLRNMARLATCLAGHEVLDAMECDAILEEAAGKEFLTVEVYRSTSQKTNKEYANIRYLARIDSIDDSKKTSETTE